jgi:hypothetical protein
MNKFQKRKMIFWFRLFALLDVLFADRFELISYHNNESKNITKFDKKEILNGGNK